MSLSLLLGSHTSFWACPLTVSSLPGFTVLDRKSWSPSYLAVFRGTAPQRRERGLHSFCTSSHRTHSPKFCTCSGPLPPPSSNISGAASTNEAVTSASGLTGQVSCHLGPAELRGCLKTIGTTDDPRLGQPPRVGLETSKHCTTIEGSLIQAGTYKFHRLGPIS